jgi:hypothetical protein
MLERIGGGQKLPSTHLILTRLTKMMRYNRLLTLGFLFSFTGALAAFAASGKKLERASAGPADVETVEFFKAIDDGQIDAKFIARNDHEARVIIINKTKQPLHLEMPEAFAGVPVLAQIGGGGFGGGGRGGGGGGLGGGGGGQQSVGGGGLGGGGGGIGGGGGGGVFSIPAEQTAKINTAVVCLDHGLRDPSSSRPYKIVRADEHIQKPAVIELLKAFGKGGLDHQSVQAAAWHLNNDLSWNELAAKLQGTRRSPSRPPYFSRQQIQAGMAYATESSRLAVVNAGEYEAARKARLEAAEETKYDDSESRSTTDETADEPESDKSEAAEKEEAATDTAEAA